MCKHGTRHVLPRPAGKTDMQLAAVETLTEGLKAPHRTSRSPRRPTDSAFGPTDSAASVGQGREVGADE